MAACGIQYEISSDTIRSGFHLIACKLCRFALRDSHGYAFQNPFSFSIKHFYAPIHSNSSFNHHPYSNRKAA